MASRVRILGLAWVLVAIGMTIFMAPHLGLRGWAWLCLHHVLMISTLVAQAWQSRRSTS
jgi:hypothetical protein